MNEQNRAPSGNTADVSVILPVYNGAEFVRGAIESVLDQTHSNWELIVIDDGSTDNTADVLAGFRDSRIRIVHQLHTGPAPARNRGIQLAEAPYIAFLDADDRWLPEKLSADLRTAAANGVPECIVYGWYYMADESYRIISRSPRHAESGMIFDTMLAVESLLLPSAAMVHRRIFDAVGSFPSTVHHQEDRAFFIKACKAFPAFPTERTLVVYRRSSDGRCRKVLYDFDEAMAAELSLIASVAPVFTAAQQERFEREQLGLLLSRFVMNGHLDHAMRLSRTFRAIAVRKSLRGQLCWLSIRTGLNFLTVAAWLARTTYHCSFRLSRQSREHATFWQSLRRSRRPLKMRAA